MYKLWSSEELETLKSHYAILDKEKLLKLLPNKSPSAIMHKASRIGLKKDTRWWSQTEIETMKNCYGTFSQSEILRVLPLKDWVSVRHKASQLNLKLKPQVKYKRSWKHFDDIILSDTEKGYIAGIIDGEGTIRICKTSLPHKNGGFYYSPVISITNTNAALMGKIRDLLKIGHFYREDEIPRLNRNARYVYTVGSIGGCKMMLNLLIDIFIVKKPHAKLLAEFLTIKENKERGTLTYRETELFEMIKKLNHKGLK